MLHANVVGGAGDRLLVLIHGYGADEHDLAGLAPVLDPLGRCFTVCPRGPYDVVMGGVPYGGAAWYERTDGGDVVPSTFLSSVLALDQLIEAFNAERSWRPERTVVIGFSQGGAMALAVSLRDTTVARPAGVACLSGMLHTAEWFRYAWDAESWPADADCPAVYVQHGSYDPMVDIERARRTRTVLQQHGIEPEYHEYPMQHEIRPESIVDLRAWLDRVLSAT